MKRVVILLILIVLISCNGNGPLTPGGKIEGDWEMTEYLFNGINISDENLFTSTRINFAYYGSLSAYGPYGWRNENPCNYPYPINVSLDEKSISFTRNCDTLNKIDPYFYRSLDTNNNGISGDWSFEYFNKRMFIIDNMQNYSRKNNIRVVFEKTK